MKSISVVFCISIIGCSGTGFHVGTRAVDAGASSDGSTGGTPSTGGSSSRSTGGATSLGGTRTSTGGASSTGGTSSSDDAGAYGTTDGKLCNGLGTNCDMTNADVGLCVQYPTLMVVCCRANGGCGCEQRGSGDCNPF